MDFWFDDSGPITVGGLFEKDILVEGLAYEGFEVPGNDQDTNSIDKGTMDDASDWRHHLLTPEYHISNFIPDSNIALAYLDLDAKFLQIFYHILCVRLSQTTSRR